MANIETEIVTGSAYWASYLVNGDASGLDDREIKLADAWCERNFPGVAWREIDVKRDDDGEPQESNFSWFYGLHTGDDYSGGDVLEYSVTYPKPVA